MSTQIQNPAYAVNGKPASAADFYAIACNPAQSVCIEACAGAGKTWMLIERMVKALAQGAMPDQILAITFTKKAAGEMRARLQKRLADADMQELRTKLLASGRSVQISTFHAWFAHLLKAAPLSVLQRLKYPFTYELLEEEQTLLPELRHAFYTKALADRDLKADFSALIESMGRSNIDDALVNLLAKRAEFELTDAQGLLETSVEASLPHEVDLVQLALVAKRLGTYKGKRQIMAASNLEIALANMDWDGIFLALLNAQNEPRSLESKEMQEADRALLTAAQRDLMCLLEAQHQHACWQYQQRMTRVGRAWLACFAQLKREQGLIDMADLERAATLLLSDAELSGAVQERLDQRLRHVMIDEFQDTNPLQWQAIHAWLSGYAGTGGGQDRPSLFIVGDPKQSIYRFRRAEPRVFMAAQSFMQETFQASLLSCDHSRRNAAGVLAVVNSAMQSAQEANEYNNFRPHTTESAKIGLALSLPFIQHEGANKKQENQEQEAKAVNADNDQAAQPDEPVWRDSFSTPREDAEETLKQREADQVARWIAANAGGQSVMVLSRKHEPLGLVQQALQRYGVQASQLQKNDLASVPAVQDVLALLNALVSPHSDLDLARALKSPLFAWTDAALMALRTAQLSKLPEAGSWFDLLTGDIKETLLRWQAWTLQLPPHDALQAIYDDGDVLNKYLAAMPYAIRHRAHAALQALLGAALQVGGGRFLSAYAFVRVMRAKVQSMKAPTLTEPLPGSAPTAQLLTVHGAKGLEADVVVLLASDPESQKMATMTTLIDWQPEDPAPQKFVFLMNESSPPRCAKTLLEADCKARGIEELNTMYVAMTRAKQTLVLSASKAHRSDSKSVWQRLQALCVPVVANDLGDSDVNHIDIALMPIQAKQPLASFKPPLTHFTLPSISANAQPDELSLALLKPTLHMAAQKGRALHRLLQWQSTDGASVAAVAREFDLSGSQALAVQAQAVVMLGGEAAWIWDESVIDWQANEYELVHEGRVLRIDRLIKHRETQGWWVIDFKSALNPEQFAVLREQLAQYREAVAQHKQVMLNQVHTAFVTSDGRWVT